MIYDDIAGLLKTTALAARTGLSTVNSTWVFGYWVLFVVSFGAFFVSLASAGYGLLNFFLSHLSSDWFDGSGFSQLYELVGYTCNFTFLWSIISVYYIIICTFIALFLSLKFTFFVNSHGPLFIQFIKNTIDWIFGEGL